MLAFMGAVLQPGALFRFLLLCCTASCSLAWLSCAALVVLLCSLLLCFMASSNIIGGLVKFGLYWVILYVLYRVKFSISCSKKGSLYFVFYRCICVDCSSLLMFQLLFIYFIQSMYFKQLLLLQFMSFPCLFIVSHHRIFQSMTGCI